MPSSPLLLTQFVLLSAFLFRRRIGDPLFGRRARFAHFDEFQVAVVHKLTPEKFQIESGEADHGSILA